MNEVTKDFINFAVSNGALRFGDFTLKSGRKSPFFFNMGDLSTGSQLLQLAKYYANTVYDNFARDRKVDVLFGPSYKGIPLAAVTALWLHEAYMIDVRYATNRKEVKDHGDEGIIMGGPIRDGDRVLIIEDVITTGKSIKEVTPIIKACGASPDSVQIVGEVIALDRRERGANTRAYALQQITDLYGFPVHAIATMDDVIEHLYTNGDQTVITADIYARLREYYAEYGGVKLVDNNLW